jgi:hypothetical protein
LRCLTEWRRYLAWIGGCGLALSLLSCQHVFYQPPLPAPQPPPQAAPAPPARPVLYVNVIRLNLRACPGMDCPKISVLEQNEAVEKVGESEDWAQVRVTQDGRLGWVASRYLSAAPMQAAPEVPSAPPATVIRPPLPPAPEVAPPLPEVPQAVQPPLPEKPPVVETPAPAKPPEAAAPAPKKKAEEVKPPAAKKKVEEAKSAKPAHPKAETAVDSPAHKAAPAAKPAGEKPAAPAEKPAPSEPAPEPGKRIRIM